MSRAKESTHVWTVADDQPQAVDDIRRDWATSQTPTWAIDTAVPNPATLRVERFEKLPSDEQARVSALIHAEKAITGEAAVGIHWPDRGATLGPAEEALQAARQVRADLDAGTGVWAGSEAGRAVRDLADARARREWGNSTAGPPRPNSGELLSANSNSDPPRTSSTPNPRPIASAPAVGRADVAEPGRGLHGRSASGMPSQ